jgi:hypothetical protein
MIQRTFNHVVSLIHLSLQPIQAVAELIAVGAGVLDGAQRGPGPRDDQRQILDVPFEVLGQLDVGQDALPAVGSFQRQLLPKRYWVYAFTL